MSGHRFLRFALVAFLVPVGLRSQAPPSSSGTQRGPDAFAFDLQDRRARELLYLLQCAQMLGRLRAEGRFGPVDSLKDSEHCIQAGGQRLGVSVRPDSATTHFERVVAVTLNNGAPYAGPLDTAMLLARERADNNAIERASAAFRKVNRDFATWSMESRGDSLSVWIMPEGVMRGQALGGEVGYLYSRDGRTMVTELSALAAYRPFTVPDTGVIVIQSDEPELPLVSEMMFANALSDQGRRVTIRTRKYASSLVGRGPSAMWLHTPRQ